MVWDDTKEENSGTTASGRLTADEYNAMVAYIKGIEAGTAIATKTAAYTATTDDDVLLCDASDGAFSINLPTASGAANTILHIKKIDSSSNAVTIYADGSETIDGDTSKIISTQYVSITVVCDGSAWYVI